MKKKITVHRCDVKFENLSVQNSENINIKYNIVKLLLEFSDSCAFSSYNLTSFLGFLKRFVASAFIVPLLYESIFEYAVYYSFE